MWPVSNDIPQSWHPLLERKGIAASYRGLAARTDGLSHEAVRRVVRGWPVKPATIVRVADALGVDPEEVLRLRGEEPVLPDVWEPPAVSQLLTQDERDALSRLVHLMVRDRVEGGGTRGDTTPIGIPMDETDSEDVTSVAEGDSAEEPRTPPGTPPPRPGPGPRR